jgi:hypothetical protein
MSPSFNESHHGTSREVGQAVCASSSASRALRSAKNRKRRASHEPWHSSETFQARSSSCQFAARGVYSTDGNIKILVRRLQGNSRTCRGRLGMSVTRPFQTPVGRTMIRPVDRQDGGLCQSLSLRERSRARLGRALRGPQPAIRSDIRHGLKLTRKLRAPRREDIQSSQVEERT